MVYHLPVELVVKVLENVDPQTLSSCKATCRTLRHLVRTTSSLAYPALLAAHALTPTTAHLSSTAETDSRTRLYRLHAYLASWRSLRFPPALDLRTDAGWQLHNGRVLSKRVLGSSAAAFLRLPSRVRAVPAHAWTVPGIPPHALIALDAIQDLLLVVQRQAPTPLSLFGADAMPRRDDDGWLARPLCLSSGARHPRRVADGLAHRLFPHTMPSGDVTSVRDLRICGNTIGILCGSKPQNMQLVLYDWITGALLAVRALPMLSLFFYLLTERAHQAIPAPTLVSFVFVTPTRILIAARERPIGPRASTYRQIPILLLHDLAGPADTQPIRFALPAFPDGGFVAGMDLTADGPAADIAADGCEGLFAPARAPATRTLALWLQHEPDAKRAPNTWVAYTLVIAARAFDRVGPDATPGATVPWAAWGPCHTRLLPGSERVVLVDGRAARRVGTAELQVYDFVPARVRRAARPGAAALTREVVRGSSAWPHAAGGAATALPYVSTRVRLPVAVGEVGEVHTCEDGLIYEIPVRATQDAGEGAAAVEMWAEGERRLLVCTA
ncbi:hypothetical protein K488DRAFT_72970 [Vararia minispora EC-137]|uniref:Uncharacterized protein n=1 Tax=Vararia minispora EC-137 TaxID=1314806 RepID=A0ACB8QCZ6_9AGAM|nr:hypothetical protein K488DRAFT_72970 [Vararia minispora EC-137]